MRYYILISLLILPLPVFASCLEKGATVVYVNGILTSSDDAKRDLDRLQNEYYSRQNDRSVKFINGFNPSHVGGLGDLLKSIEQAYQGEGKFIEDTDLKTILLQIQPQITTRKIVLVGHSQGTFYTNALYEYLTKHGVPETAIAVYNIATPASFVAGGGAYLTSATDKVINKVREAIKSAPSKESFGAGAALATVAQTRPKEPLPPNTAFILNSSEAGQEKGGHSFSGVYLENAPSTIVSTIANSVSRLSAAGDDKNDCFAPPTESLLYKAERGALGVLDFTAAVSGPALAFTRDFLADVGAKVPANAASAAGSLLDAITPKPRTANLPGSYNIVSALYGSSMTEADLQDLLGTDQGGTVAPASTKPSAPKLEAENDKQKGEVRGVETTKQDALPGTEPLIPPPAAVGGGGVSPGFGGGGAVQSVVEESPVVVSTSTPPNTTVSLSGPPSVVSVVANGQILGTRVPEYPYPYLAVVASSTSRWPVVITFNEDIQTPPTVVDGRLPNDYLDGNPQSVSDCGDADASTFCFIYTPTFVIFQESDWEFRISGARDSSSEEMATTSYHFILDTLGSPPTITKLYFTGPVTEVQGRTLDWSLGASIGVAFNGGYYRKVPTRPEWTAVFPTAFSLPEGVYEVTASSSDAGGNPSTVATGTIIVDLTPPTMTLISGPTEGEEVASTSPVIFEFEIADTYLEGAECTYDNIPLAPCQSPFEMTVGPGTHTLNMYVYDLASHITEFVRTFTVLP